MKNKALIFACLLLGCISCSKSTTTPQTSNPTQSPTTTQFTPTFTGKYLIKDSITHTTAHTAPILYNYDTVQFNKVFTILIDSNLKQLVHEGDTLNYIANGNKYHRFDPHRYYMNKTIRIVNNEIRCVFTRGKTALYYEYFFNGALIP